MRTENKCSRDDKYICLSELMYLCFFGIMLFAKGIGLYDGQFVYKIVLLISFACLGVKMLITEHSYKEWLLIIALSLLSAGVYLRSGEKGILICTAMVVAMKNVSMERVFKLGLIVWSISAGGIFLYSLLNMNSVTMEVQYKFGQMYVPRYFMGFPHPNVLHVSYFVFVILYIWVIQEKYNWKHLLGLMLGNIFIFIYSFSVTGFATVMFFLILALYIKVKKITAIDYWLVRMVFLGSLIISIILPILAEDRLLRIADKIFNYRIGYSKHFLTVDKIKLFGNSLAEITDSILTMDNSYVFSLIIYGVITFVLILIMYYLLTENYIKEKKNIELAIIVSYFVAGITEPLLFNTSFKNISLLFVGNLLFQSKKEICVKEFAIIKMKDYKFKLKLCDIKSNFDLCLTIKKRVIVLCGIVSLIASMIILKLTSISERILQRKEEEISDLIAFERIRIGMTSCVCVYLVIILVIYIIRRKKYNSILRTNK